MRAALALCLVLLGAACTTERAPMPTIAPGTDPPSAPEPLSWRTGAAMPTPRTEVGAAAISESTLVAAGGFTADGSATAVVEAYDVAADTWSSLPELPSPRHHAGVAGLGGHVYVVGGYGADGSALDDVVSLAPDEDAWRAEPAVPTARGALAVAIVDGRIHAVGGATGFGGGGLTGAHEAFDPATGEWETLAPLPDPRDHLAAAGIGDVLYVVGGRKLSLTTNVDRLDIFEDDEWTSGPSMPTARGGLAAAATEDALIVVGGEQPSGTFEEAEVFDPVTQEWTVAEPLPTPRHGLGAAAVRLEIVVVGGGPTPGLDVSDATEILITPGR